MVFCTHPQYQQLSYDNIRQYFGASDESCLLFHIHVDFHALCRNFLTNSNQKLSWTAISIVQRLYTGDLHETLHWWVHLPLTRWMYGKLEIMFMDIIPAFDRSENVWGCKSIIWLIKQIKNLGLGNVSVDKVQNFVHKTTTSIFTHIRNQPFASAGHIVIVISFFLFG